MTDPFDPFLREILATPSNADPKLIYADWLNDHDDPLGEIIRLQCEPLQKVNPSQEQENRQTQLEYLLKLYGPIWFGKHPAKMNNGVAERITCDESDFFKTLHSAGRRRRVLQHLVIKNLRRKSFSIANSPLIKRLAELSFHGPFIRILRPFFKSQQTKTLLGFHLDFRVLNEPTLPMVLLESLCESSFAKNIVSLSLTSTQLPEGAAKLLTGNCFPQLRRLDLSQTLLWPESLSCILDSYLAYRLDSLSLSGSFLTDQMMKELLQSPLGKRIQELDVSCNRLTDMSCQTLAESPQELRLTHLNLASNRIGDRGFRRLGCSNALPKLRELNVNENRIRDFKLLQDSSLFAANTVVETAGNFAHEIEAVRKLRNFHRSKQTNIQF